MMVVKVVVLIKKVLAANLVANLYRKRKNICLLIGLFAFVTICLMLIWPVVVEV